MQERHQLNKIKVQWAEQLYVRFEAWYISSPSAAEKKREIRKSYVFLRTWATMANFSCVSLEL